MEYGYNNWLMVGVSIGLTLYFVKSVFKPRTKTDWSTYRSFGAFVIALFAEMYGFPLTIYLLAPVLGSRLNLDLTHDNGHLLNTLLGFKGDPHFSPPHMLSYILIIGGAFLIENAWEILYKSTKVGKVATSGAYKYIRHPQYVGFSLIIVGFLLQWPTLITILMAPFLLWRYASLSKLEEKEIEAKYGNEYRKYKKQTPAYIPSLVKILISLGKTTKPIFMKS